MDRIRGSRTSLNETTVDVARRHHEFVRLPAVDRLSRYGIAVESVMNRPPLAGYDRANYRGYTGIRWNAGIIYRRMVWDAASRTATGIFWFPGHNVIGPPGYTHGGVVSTAHDDALAMAAWAWAGEGVYTKTMSVALRAGTPVDEIVWATARVVGVEVGARSTTVTVECTMSRSAPADAPGPEDIFTTSTGTFVCRLAKPLFTSAEQLGDTELEARYKQRLRRLQPFVADPRGGGVAQHSDTASFWCRHPDAMRERAAWGQSDPRVKAMLDDPALVPSFRGAVDGYTATPDGALWGLSLFAGRVHYYTFWDTRRRCGVGAVKFLETAEGAPTLVHGGCVAALLDDVAFVGLAPPGTSAAEYVAYCEALTSEAGVAARLTLSLDFRYRRPTPLLECLRLRSECTRWRRTKAGDRLVATIRVQLLRWDTDDVIVESDVTVLLRVRSLGEVPALTQEASEDAASASRL